MIYKFISPKSKQPAFIIISMVFLAVSDILSAIGIIAAAIITAFYAKFSSALRRREILFLTLTITIFLVYAAGFVGFSIYNFQKFESAHSFFKFCPIITSFFFLQAVRFVLDIYKGRVYRNICINDALEFLLFYPRLVMGPVMTYNEHREMLKIRVQDSESIGEGLGLFIKGLSKKLLIADTIGLVFMPLYGNTSPDTTLIMSWFIVLAFALEFYFTVAGYADMARGISLCYGFKIPENYKYPIFTGSLTCFGNEWNMSVVSWCKSCFAPMLRGSKWQSIIGITAAWFMIGFWYRPSLQMIVWGVWFGFWIGLDGYIKKRFNRIHSLVYGISFFLVTFFGWAFFSADSISEGINMIGLLFGSSASILRVQDLYYISQAGVIMVIAVYSATGNFGTVIERMRRIPALSGAINIIGFIMQILLLLLCIVVLATNNDITALQFKGAI